MGKDCLIVAALCVVLGIAIGTLGSYFVLLGVTIVLVVVVLIVPLLADSGSHAESVSGLKTLFACMGIAASVAQPMWLSFLIRHASSVF